MDDTKIAELMRKNTLAAWHEILSSSELTSYILKASKKVCSNRNISFNKPPLKDLVSSITSGNVEYVEKAIPVLLCLAKLSELKTYLLAIPSTPKIDKILLLVSEALKWRNTLVERNLSLATFFAKKFTYFEKEVEELVSVGYMGLVLAAERFDYTRGMKFSSYVKWWIMQPIMRSLHSSAPCSLSTTFVERMTKLSKLEFKNYGIEDYDLAKLMRISVAGLQNLRECKQSRVSLQKTYLDGSLTVEEIIEDPHENYEELEDRIDRVRMINALKSYVEGLDSKKKFIIVQRFGLMGESERSLQDIGNDFNISRERVRQIQEDALKDLQINFLESC